MSSFHRRHRFLGDNATLYGVFSGSRSVVFPLLRLSTNGLHYSTVQGVGMSPGHQINRHGVLNVVMCQNVALYIQQRKIRQSDGWTVKIKTHIYKIIKHVRELLILWSDIAIVLTTNFKGFQKL